MIMEAPLRILQPWWQTIQTYLVDTQPGDSAEQEHIRPSQVSDDGTHVARPAGMGRRKW
jgi:hypothetical protein